MAAVTWRKMGGLNVAPILNAATAANEQMSEGIAGIGEAATQYADNRTETETNAFITDLMTAPDQRSRDNMIAAASEASKGFLDMEKVNVENFALGQPERDKQIKIEDEKREVANAKDLFRFEDSIQDENQAKEESFKTYEATVQYNRDLLKLDIEWDQREAEALALATSQAAREQALAKIANEKAEALNKFNKEHAETVRKNKVEEKINADKLKRELDQNTGLGLLIENQGGGVLDAAGLGMHSDDYAAWGEMRSEMLKRGLNTELVDKWMGTNIIFNDNVVFNQNDFQFSADGKDYNFGKWFQTEEEDINRLAASIMNSENDAAQKATASIKYKELFPDRTYKDFVEAYEDYDILTESMPNNADDFIKALSAK